MKRILIFLLACLAVFHYSFITGCANIVPPTGGPKDTLAPVLTDATPKQHALKMNSNTIELYFDEYLDLKEIRNNLIVSPVPKQTPTVVAHLRTITITLKDTLKPNTTYSLDFGRAITDINEGNVLKNFTYTFSTGNYLDSMTYGGRVIMAYTGKPDSTMIAMLHDRLYDSAVAYERPRYIARIDSGGNFRFDHVKPGIYALYALKDESGTHEYTARAQTFAFAENSIDLNGYSPPLLLYAYADTTNEFKRPVKKPLLVAPPKKTDKEKIKRLSLGGNLQSGQLELNKNLEITFQIPIKYFDSSKVRFLTDSFETITSYHFNLDSSSKKLTLFYNWKENTGYHLLLDKDFAEDTTGLKLLKTDTISFRTKKETDYGILRIRFKNLDLKRHPVLLFFQSDKIVLSYKIGPSFRYNNRLFMPGDYDLRILYDTNQNGVWDPGNFYDHLQPEIAVPIPKKLSVRPDWENEVDITL